MKTEIGELTIDQLLNLRRNEMLKANPEYQRGEVWNRTQQKKLIDSVMRGYPIPLIYLHHIRRTVAGMQREDFEIIDGQQRINAFFTSMKVPLSSSTLSRTIAMRGFRTF